ncbi:MAG: hypothetical protein OEW19_00110 [Acidobacteriota bacterium]|nr:hypothetical protein [Acidobacteriota bacterium]
MDVDPTADSRPGRTGTQVTKGPAGFLPASPPKDSTPVGPLNRRRDGGHCLPEPRTPAAKGVRHGTALDFGLHANLDGGGWTRLEVEGPNDRPLLGILTAGGEYESVVRLSHVLAAPVEATVSGFPAAESCDAEPLPGIQSPVLIDWDPVTTSHPTLGRAGSIEISRYQVFVEQDATKLSLDLPPTVTAFEIPPSLTASKGLFKFEIIARTTSGNNTAIESCFRVW